MRKYKDALNLFIIGVILSMLILGCTPEPNIDNHKGAKHLPAEAHEIEIIDKKWVKFTYEGTRILFFMSDNSKTAMIPLKCDCEDMP